MSTHNIGYYEDLTKNILNYHQISPNTHLISSAGISEHEIYGHLYLIFKVGT